MGAQMKRGIVAPVIPKESPAELARIERMKSARESLKKSLDGFLVQKKLCETCIYRPDSPLDLKKLEEEVRDKRMGFKGYRICHHASPGKKVCCRGFWNAHKDEFPAGQIAQRLSAVTFVDDSGKGKALPQPKKPVKTPPKQPEVLFSDCISEETLKSAIQASISAGRSSITYEALCASVTDGDALSSNIYRQQKFALK
jgi:hypothetical protein